MRTNEELIIDSGIGYGSLIFCIGLFSCSLPWLVTGGGMLFSTDKFMRANWAARTQETAAATQEMQSTATSAPLTPNLTATLDDNRNERRVENTKNNILGNTLINPDYMASPQSNTQNSTDDDKDEEDEEDEEDENGFTLLKKNK